MKREESATSSKAFIRCWRHSCLVLFFLHQHHNNEQVPLLRKDWYVGKLSGFIFLLFNFLFIVTWSTRWSLWHFTNRFFFFYSVLRWEVRTIFGGLLFIPFLLTLDPSLIRQLYNGKEYHQTCVWTLTKEEEKKRGQPLFSCVSSHF